MYMFVVDGLRIALVSGLFVMLLRALRLSRAWCGAVSIPAIWFYTAATGWEVALAGDAALVLRGDVHGTRILLLSDLSRAGQSELLARTNDLRADIVVAGLPDEGESFERTGPKLMAEKFTGRKMGRGMGPGCFCLSIFLP